MFNRIPKMDDILKYEKVAKISEEFDTDYLKSVINECLNDLRCDIKNRISEQDLMEKIGNLESEILKKISFNKRDRLVPVVNATGTVIHTNLGRSLINKEMSESIDKILLGYSNLEYNLETGKRGLRYSNIEELITAITGAESAMVVNNNAAAVMLVLSEFAKGKEAIISRGELIEIGGSFRIPEVMKLSGCDLVEVGTTNKTHLFDYQNAITDNTGVILKVHTSNYKVIGFSEGVSSEELKQVADENNIVLIEDLGSGVLVNLEEYGLTHEPTVQESIKSGIDIVTFSGDKLLGGPQAGIIIGKKEYIDRLRKNQLTRALRVDKITIKLLEEVFKVYNFEKEPAKVIPTLKMITLDENEILSRATKLSEELNILGYSTEIKEDYSEVGGGSLPTEELRTHVVCVKDDKLSENEIDYKLRHLSYPVVGRIHEGNYILDPRTFVEGDISRIVLAFKEIKEI